MTIWSNIIVVDWTKLLNCEFTTLLYLLIVSTFKENRSSFPKAYLKLFKPNAPENLVSVHLNQQSVICDPKVSWWSHNYSFLSLFILGCPKRYKAYCEKVIYVKCFLVGKIKWHAIRHTFLSLKRYNYHYVKE